MDAQKVDMFIVANARYFKPTMITSIREKLLSLDDSKWGAIQSVGYKDPTTALIVSILLGYLGIDRFYIGNTTLGLLKLLTCGGASVWTIVDWFLIMDSTRDRNAELLSAAIN